jgi:type 1 fimbria pilin
MRKLFAAAAVATFVLALSAPAFAADMTVKGQVVDQTCFLKDKANTGNDHGNMGDMKDCATICAKKGQPMAILTEDGKLYQITGGLAADKNAKLIAHISHTVEITGDVTEKDGKMSIAADTLKMIKR